MSNVASLSTTYGYLLSALLYTAYAVYALTLGERSFASRWLRLAFNGALLSTAAWAWVGIAVQNSPGEVPVWLQVGFDIGRYAFWLLFLVKLARRQSSAVRSWSESALSISAVFLVAVSAASTVIIFAGLSMSGFYSRLSLYCGLALPVLALVLVEQIFRNVPKECRWHVKPLCIALCCIFIFDLYLHSQAILFGHFDSDTVAVRGVVHGVAVPLFLIASFRQPGWINQIGLSQSAAFHSTTLLLAGTYLLLVSALGYYIRYVGGDWGTVLATGLVCIALVGLGIAAFSGLLRGKLRVLLGKHFFKYRYDYRKEWLAFTATLSVESSPQGMEVLVLRALSNLLDSPGGALWLKTTDRQTFAQTARLNMPKVDQLEAVESRFCSFLATTGWVVDIDEYRVAPNRYRDLSIPPSILGLAEAWLVVPLFVAADLIGFVVLKKSKIPIDVNWEVTDLLKTASRQAAAFLSQLHATEALLEISKFDAFNRMSAFVVHDLKNIVTQLSLMMKNAKRLRDNAEFQEDMLMTVDNSLEKMRQLMLQLRNGETSTSGVVGVDLKPIVRRIEQSTLQQGRRIDVHVADGAIIARGHEQKLERVVGHIAQNALDATAASGRLWIKLRRVQGQARVEVGDTGHGMSPEFIRAQLFKPFHSTKETGMGIGAYESLQYVRELGGEILVDSQVGSGTVVTIVLPVFEVSQSSDLQLSGAT